MIEVPLIAFEEMVADARRRAPAEACGLLGGHGDTVEAVYPLENVSEHPSCRFEMKPEEQVAAYEAMKREGQTLVGTYHSHPRSEIVNLGPTDWIALAEWSDLWHLVIAPASGSIGVHRLP